MLYKLLNLSYSYLNKFPALKDMDLNIREGERIALLGANGSGKSTLLMILAGLAFPDAGDIEFMDKVLTEDSFKEESFLKIFRSSVGIVFQNSDTQLFSSNVEDEIRFGLNQLGLSKEEADDRIARYMDLMGVANLKDRHPQYISIGEKKRVAIASVLAMEPRVLLLDEPSAGLDPRTIRQLIDTISALSEKGYTIITATQDIHIVPEIADRAVVLSEEKRIVKDAPVQDILNDRDFLEAHNLIHIHAHKHEGKVHVHPHEHPTHDHPHS